jgi:DNA helicase-2/ATP-dependent DNA helicase PcrA
MNYLPAQECSSYLDELNTAQRAAVVFGVGKHAPAQTTPPLLVIAGAGSGKTTTLAHRVAHLILNGADPRRILLLTFARRMAVEMTRRVEHICATELKGRASFAGEAIEWSGTFHAMGAKLLRLYAESIGLEPGFSILDRSDAADLMDLVRDELELSKTGGRFPKKATCLAIYSYAVNAQIPLRETLDRAFPWCAEWAEPLNSLFARYVETKQAQAVLDYDDLLLYWSQMMQAGEIARLVAERFDHVLVDEYQDTNALQAAILLGLKPDGAGVTVVGDDAQAIYSFRSATVRNILDFPSRFDPPAEVVRLEQNYRSTQPILEACNRIIGKAGESFAKILFATRTDGRRPRLAMVADETAQLDYVIERILANREGGLDLRDQAVLFRTSHHASQLEVELVRRNIPFVKFGGLKFLEAGHVKDVLAILRWVENPRDHVAGLRVLKLVPGVGPKTARRVLIALEKGGYSRSALSLFRAPPAAAKAWPPFVDLITELAATPLWQGQVERLRAWYDPLLDLLYDDPHPRRGDLDQLERMAAQHPSRSSFLTDLTLDPPEASGGEAGVPLKDEDWLTLSTIHSAKGQEWRAVFVLNVVDGCIPSDLATGTPEEVNEERRLLYVAMTRARDDLVLMQPLRFFIRGQARGGNAHVLAPRSRFIAEADLDAFELVGDWLHCGIHEVIDGRPPSTSVDLKAQVRAMWR